jgi:hypothetical protein
MSTKRVLQRHSLSFLIGWALRNGFRQLTGRMRTLPDFIIIGGQRCGTTSLYNYLVEHPQVSPAFMKETHFFTRNYRKGLNWYRANFPPLWYRNRTQRRDGTDLVSGEATPYYLFYPHTPQRVSKAVPDAKLIVLLRNPVDRAYSQYHHEIRQGLVTLSFKDALKREQEELPKETAKILGDEDYHSVVHQSYSYVARGIYVDQLERWTQYFSKEQMLILRSEDLAEEPVSTLGQVADFLKLPRWQPREYTRYHLAHYDPIDPATRERLANHFRDHNQRLYEFLGRDFCWES